MQSQSETPTRSAATARPGKIGVAIPTYNAERHWPELEASLRSQDLHADEILIVDSSSSDRTRELAGHSGFRVTRIAQTDFNHGGTRKLASSLLPGMDIVVFLTQDAVLATPVSLRRMVDALDDPAVAAVYGRQLPRKGAGAIERHARLFNYPEASQVRSLDDRGQLGLRTIFFSNSFAAYRRSALEAVGGFPGDVIFGEDTYVVAKLLLDGWKVAYSAEATVLHSHALSVGEEFRRYFDIGVNHEREGWVLEAFGQPSGDGVRFIGSELRYVGRHAPLAVPMTAVRTLSKLVAYRLGKRWRRLPRTVTRRLSASPSFWAGPR